MSGDVAVPEALCGLTVTTDCRRRSDAHQCRPRQVAPAYVAERPPVRARRPVPDSNGQAAEDDLRRTTRGAHLVGRPATGRDARRAAPRRGRAAGSAATTPTASNASLRRRPAHPRNCTSNQPERVHYRPRARSAQLNHRPSRAAPARRRRRQRPPMGSRPCKSEPAMAPSPPRWPSPPLKDSKKIGASSPSHSPAPKPTSPATSPSAIANHPQPATTPNGYGNPPAPN